MRRLIKFYALKKQKKTKQIYIHIQVYRRRSRTDRKCDGKKYAWISACFNWARICIAFEQQWKNQTQQPRCRAAFRRDEKWVIGLREFGSVARQIVNQNCKPYITIAIFAWPGPARAANDFVFCLAASMFFCTMEFIGCWQLPTKLGNRRTVPLLLTKNSSFCVCCTFYLNWTVWRSINWFEWHIYTSYCGAAAILYTQQRPAIPVKKTMNSE